MTLRELESYLEKVNWLGAEKSIPSWSARGIAHGFEGKGFSLPPGGHSLDQIHGAHIVALESQPEKLPPGDGLMSGSPGQLIAVKTADCLPLLITHPRAVWALHAGWRGLAKGIVGEALQSMRERGWAIEEAEFALGPCISLDSFEVGPELIQAFRDDVFQMSDEECAFAVSKGRGDRWHLDLATLALLQLARWRIEPEKVHVIRSCTKKEGGLWHSFRRDAQAAGRNWSWIELSP